MKQNQTRNDKNMLKLKMIVMQKIWQNNSEIKEKARTLFILNLIY